MKEKKELKITFDVIDNQVKNAKLEGAKEDLTAVMCWGGEVFTDSAINSVLRFYLECPSREKFLAKFLAMAAEYDAMLISQMKKQKGGLS